MVVCCSPYSLPRVSCSLMHYRCDGRTEIVTRLQLNFSIRLGSCHDCVCKYAGIQVPTQIEYKQRWVYFGDKTGQGEAPRFAPEQWESLNCMLAGIAYAGRGRGRGEAILPLLLLQNGANTNLIKAPAGLKEKTSSAAKGEKFPFSFIRKILYFIQIR